MIAFVVANFYAGSEAFCTHLQRWVTLRTRDSHPAAVKTIAEVWPQTWTKYIQRHQTLNVGYYWKLTSKCAWRQVFICLRPPIHSPPPRLHTVWIHLRYLFTQGRGGWALEGRYGSSQEGSKIPTWLTVSPVYKLMVSEIFIVHTGSNSVNPTLLLLLKKGSAAIKKVWKWSCPTKVETGPTIKTELPKPLFCTIYIEVYYSAKFLLFYKSTGSGKKNCILF